MDPLIHIVSDHDDLLVLHKPAGLVCHPTKGDPRSSLVGRVRLHLGEARRFHLVNRLDRETSGLTLIALNDALARELRLAWERRLVHKEYWAIVSGHPKADRIEIDAPLGRAEGSVVAIKDSVRADGAPSRTRCEVLRRFSREQGDFSLLRVTPETGRKHQIRIHLAHIGHPIVGDKIYGSDEELYLKFVEGRLTPEDRERLILINHALHAGALQVPLPTGMASFSTEAEPEFQAFALPAEQRSDTSLEVSTTDFTDAHGWPESTTL